MEIPQEDIAQALQPLPILHRSQTTTFAQWQKLKIEIDSDTATEKEPEQEMEDVDETDQVEINERRPVMVNDNAFIIDPKLAHARLRMQVPYYPHVKDCNSVDSILTASSYHGIYGRQLHAQELEGKLAMVRLAIPQDAEQFQQGMR